MGSSAFPIPGAIQFAAQGGPVGEIGALSPEPAGLTQSRQPFPGLLLPQEGIDRVADQGALAASTAQGQCLQSLPLRRGEMDLGALHRDGSIGSPRRVEG